MQRACSSEGRRGVELCAGVGCFVSLGLVVVLRIPLGGAGPGSLLGLGAKIWKLIWPIAGLTRRLTML